MLKNFEGRGYLGILAISFSQKCFACIIGGSIKITSISPFMEYRNIRRIFITHNYMSVNEVTGATVVFEAVVIEFCETLMEDRHTHTLFSNVVDAEQFVIDELCSRIELYYNEHENGLIYIYFKLKDNLVNDVTEASPIDEHENYYVIQEKYRTIEKLMHIFEPRRLGINWFIHEREVR